MKLHQATHQDFEKVKNAYIDIINNTPNMEQHARWVVSGAQQTAKEVYRKFFNQIGILPLVSGNSVS